MHSRLIAAMVLGLTMFGSLHAEDLDKETTGLADKLSNAAGNTATIANSHPIVVVTTSLGVFKMELWPDKAPNTVANFLGYVERNFYDGLIFHRVIKGFMIQGGGFTPDMTQKATRMPVANEARADVHNNRGTVAIARTMQVDSATAQFFVNVVDNRFLNHSDNSAQGFGYCVFGKVTEGMDVVDKIANVVTGNEGQFQNVPKESVVIENIRLDRPGVVALSSARLDAVSSQAPQQSKSEVEHVLSEAQEREAETTDAVRPKPAFGITVHVEDDPAKGADIMGNGDGRIQRGESFDLVVVVANTTTSIAKDVTCTVTLPADKSLKAFSDLHYAITELAPAGATTNRINLTVPSSVTISNAPICSIDVKEDGSKVAQHLNFVMPTDLP